MGICESLCELGTGLGISMLNIVVIGDDVDYLLPSFVQTTMLLFVFFGILRPEI